MIFNCSDVHFCGAQSEKIIKYDLWSLVILEGTLQKGDPSREQPKGKQEVILEGSGNALISRDQTEVLSTYNLAMYLELFSIHHKTTDQRYYIVQYFRDVE